MLKCLALLPLVAVAMPASAQVAGRPSLAEVKPGPKRYFYRDAAGCPALTSACRRTAYLLPGDQLVADAIKGHFTHVVFISKGGRPTEGWMESAALTGLLTPNRPPIAAWLGHWQRDDEAEIDIGLTDDPGQIHLDGQALWGIHDPVRVEHGIHVYQVNADVRFKGDSARYPDNDQDDDCRFAMRLLGPYLLVEQDEDAVCAANVSYSGVYRR
jgi:hypothetical protein